jgi:hypothetical protein
MRRIALTLLGPMLLTSCATITTGRFEEIHVSSSPSVADATLVCGGHPSGEGRTPATFKIRRNAGDCALTVRKEGFEARTIALEQGVNPAYWANMIFSPIPPAAAFAAAVTDSGDKPLGVAVVAASLAIFGVDFWTGAVHAHKPGSVDVVLKPK